MGEPPPDVSWSKNGKSFNETATKKIKTIDYFTSLKIEESVRADDGIYMITAVNIHGKDAAEAIGK